MSNTTPLSSTGFFPRWLTSESGWLVFSDSLAVLSSPDVYCWLLQYFRNSYSILRRVINAGAWPVLKFCGGWYTMGSRVFWCLLSTEYRCVSQISTEEWYIYFSCALKLHSSADDKPWKPVSWIVMSSDDRYFPIRVNLLKITRICLNSCLLFQLLSKWKIFLWTGCTLYYRILVISFYSSSEYVIWCQLQYLKYILWHFTSYLTMWLKKILISLLN